MTIALLVLASIAFAVGGLFMKLSAGLTRSGPTAAFLLLFIGGAVLQALGMRRLDFSVSYIFVLGLEAVVTVLLSVLYLQESCPPSRVAAILVIVGGIAWLRGT